MKPIKFSLFAWWLIAAFSILFLWNTRSKQEGVFISDAGGYYAYLPSLFLNNGSAHPFSWSTETFFPKELEQNGEVIIGINSRPDNQKINKYYIGTAICQMPFFALGHVYSLAFEKEHHGFTHVHQVAILWAAICFLLFGFWQLRGWLRDREFSDLSIAITLLLLFFGTNLIHYVLQEASMSHVYSFAVISTFIRLLDRQLHAWADKRLYWLAALFGLLILIRPVNALVILTLLPLAGDKENLLAFFRKLFSGYKNICLAAAIFIGLIFLQALTYYIQSGHWWVDGYYGERFDFAHPFIPEVLWSWRKGWLLYTPIVVLIWFGTFLFLKKRFLFFSWWLWMLVLIYITSSWTCWTYGGSFSQRPFVDQYAFLAWPLAALVTFTLDSKTWWRWVLGAALGFCLLLNMVQWKQYRMSILPYDQMTGEAYMHIFMNTNGCLIGAHSPFDAIQYPGLKSVRIPLTRMNFEQGADTVGWKNIDVLATPSKKALSGKRVFVFDGAHQHAATWRRPFKLFVVNEVLENMRAGKQRLWIDYSFQAYPYSRNTDAYVVVAVLRKGTALHWDARPLIKQVHVSNQWLVYQNYFPLPADLQTDDELVINLVHQDGTTTLLDDIVLDMVLEDLN
jgi:hypothetical protein